jgi:hypothetical protein
MQAFVDRLLFPLGFVLVASTSPPAFGAAEQDAVRQLLMKTFDKAEARLSVDPIVVDGDVAIAGWVQGDLGGRALLRRKGDLWEIDLCAGDALKESASLEKLGLQKPRAETLAAAVQAAERRLDPDVLQKFSRFDGVFAVDEKGGHTAADPHHRPIR